jgi:hypothetical protein
MMLRTKKEYIGLVAGSVLMTLLIGTANADQVVEARAERICAAIGQTDPGSHGAFSVDNLTIRRDANGAVTLERGGRKLGEIAQSSYVDHTVCFVEVRALISSDAETEIGAVQRPSPPLRHLD